MRYFMDISYKGTSFHGWQIQPNGITVQEEIEKGLKLLLKEEIGITGSGRTDTGVHAKQQIAHFDTNKDLDSQDFAYKLNSYFAEDISIRKIRKVDEEASARFSAVSRTYHYHIHQHKDPSVLGQSYFFKPKLNVSEINKACKILLNWENFECFSKVHTEVNHFHCNITFAKWYRIGPKNLFVITANRFLRGMVRAIVGTLIEVGLEKMTLEEFQAILESNDRKQAGRAVPAVGLFLQEVKYPDNIYLD
ncbi:MAG: tRNA pseudouridine(38-40) synthase TruA [Bacteroidota bacterium]